MGNGLKLKKMVARSNGPNACADKDIPRGLARTKPKVKGIGQMRVVANWKKRNTVNPVEKKDE